MISYFEMVSSFLVLLLRFIKQDQSSIKSSTNYFPPLRQPHSPICSVCRLAQVLVILKPVFFLLFEASLSVSLAYFINTNKNKRAPCKVIKFFPPLLCNTFKNRVLFTTYYFLFGQVLKILLTILMLFLFVCLFALQLCRSSH